MTQNKKTGHGLHHRVASGHCSGAGQWTGHYPGAVAGLPLIVLFFAGAREAVGTPKETVDLDAGATLADLAEWLAGRHGESLRAVMPTCAIWLNGEPAPPETTLRAGDEVALLPPVSGGS